MPCAQRMFPLFASMAITGNRSLRISFRPHLSLRFYPTRVVQRLKFNMRLSSRYRQPVAISGDGKILVIGGVNLVYTSSDFGDTWATNSPYTYGGFMSVVASTNGTVLGAFKGGPRGDSTSSFFQFDWSTNSGTSWTESFGPLDSNNFGSVACSADGTKLVAAVADVGIFTSTDVNLRTDSTLELDGNVGLPRRSF
jgi:hypothetical protein